MNEFVDKLKSIHPSDALSRTRLTTHVQEHGKPVDYETLGLDELERIKLQRIIDVLGHPSLHEMINQGSVAFGLVRPHAEHNSKGLSDSEAESAILDKLNRSPLEVIFTHPLVLTDDMVDAFWNEDGEKRGLAGYSPTLHTDRFPNKWEEFKDMMTTGASTMFLCRSMDPKVNAPEALVARKGSWELEPGTIRHEFAVGQYPYNNLLHSSDTPGDVIREIGIVSAHLSTIAH